MTDHSNIVKDFASLFAGRTDAYGSWEGGCIKTPVTQASYTKHLWGQEYIGIYPMMDDNTVWWGCSDIDVNDIDQARNIQLALKLKLIESWVEKTIKGFHIWVFAKQPIEARVMRRALLAAHSASKVPAKEINPKQEKISGYGNYVRLPYPGALFEFPTTRYILDSSDKPMLFEDFIEKAKTYAVSQNDLEPIAKLYVPKSPIQFTINNVYVPADIVKTMLSPYTLKIFIEGPTVNSDRSTTLVRLAYHLRADGLSPEMAYGVIRTADKSWGKFSNREDGEIHLTKIIADVYGE